MALTFNGVALDVPASELPSGYTKPTVTLVANPEYRRSIDITVAKSTVENATDDTTVDNILTDVQTQLDAIVTADYDTVGLTVTASGRVIDLSTNFDISGVKFTNGAINYTAKVELLVTTA